MAAITRTDDSYDVGLFSGVVQGDTIHLECFAASADTYYYKKPTAMGDTTAYDITLTKGVASPRIVPEGSVIYSDALCTTPVVAGMVICTHIGARIA